MCPLCPANVLLALLCSKARANSIEAYMHQGTCKQLAKHVQQHTHTHTQLLSVRRCVRLSDGALSAVARCGKLQHLAVSNVHAFGPFSMAALAACCAESLETLDISFCRQACRVLWVRMSAGLAW
eukprot:1151105-Pelagomonas_calceolata.AAC.6